MNGAALIAIIMGCLVAIAVIKLVETWDTSTLNKVDRERLERIDKNLLDLDSAARKSGKEFRELFAATEQSQGTLLAALNERNDLLVVAIDHIRVSLNAIEKCQDEDLGRFGALGHKLDGSHKDLQQGIISVKGQLDGIRDGLCDELNGAMRGIKEELSVTRSGLCAEIGGLRTRLCPVCEKLPSDINPTLTQLSINIGQHLLGMKITDKHVDWIENEIDRFLNYAMQRPRKPIKMNPADYDARPPRKRKRKK